ncbi:MAG TPA: YqgE/AlgH family protein [Acidimicrobiales bacterium]
MEWLGSSKGRLLVATPQLGDPNFARTVIFMLEDNDEGALGLVLNRPSPLDVTEPLPDWSRLVASPSVVFVGGPVSRSSVIALAVREPAHELPDEAWTAVDGMVGVLDLTADADLIGAGLAEVRVFAGYAGWDVGQLATEIDEGAWFVVDSAAKDTFTDHPEGLWANVLRRQPGPLRQFADYPPDPSVN